MTLEQLEYWREVWKAEGTKAASKGCIPRHRLPLTTVKEALTFSYRQEPRSMVTQFTGLVTGCDVTDSNT